MSEQQPAPAPEAPPDAGVRYRFVGAPGTYLNGVPARDLTDADLAMLSDEQKTALEATGLYEPAAASGGAPQPAPDAAAPPPATEKEA